MTRHVIKQEKRHKMAAGCTGVSASGWDTTVAGEGCTEQSQRSTPAGCIGETPKTYTRSTNSDSPNTQRKYNVNRPELQELGPFVSASSLSTTEQRQWEVREGGVAFVDWTNNVQNQLTDTCVLENDDDTWSYSASNNGPKTVPTLTFLPEFSPDDDYPREHRSMSEDSLLTILEEFNVTSEMKHDFDIKMTPENKHLQVDTGVPKGQLASSKDIDSTGQAMDSGHQGEREGLVTSEETSRFYAQNEVTGTHNVNDTCGSNMETDLGHSAPDMTLCARSSGTSTSEWHCHHQKKPDHDKLARNQLIIVCTLCASFMVGEAVGGVLSNSLALFTDVLHLASDLISFFISLLAIYLAKKPATKTMSFGYHRAEVLGALFSVFIIWAVTGVLCYMAIERIMQEHYKNVKPDEMLVTASLGVMFNIIMGIVLHSEKCCGSATARAILGHGHSHGGGGHSHKDSHNSADPDEAVYEHLLQSDSEHELTSPVASQEVHTAHKRQRHKNINVRAAFIHVIGDIIQSVGVLVASLIIKLAPEEKYKLADPICTFLFSLLVLVTTFTVLRDTLQIMMEGVPRDVQYSEVIEDFESIHGVKAVHGLSIWAFTVDKNALTVHLAIDSSTSHQTVLETANTMMKEKHNFISTTIQVETYTPAIMDNCHNCRRPKC